MSLQNTDPEDFANRLITLFGSIEAAREVFDYEHTEMEEVWNQDASQMGRILRSHLFVEYFLTMYLEHRNSHLGSLEDARLTFAQKVALANNERHPENYLIPGIRRLNQVRNRVAHTMRAEVTEQDRDSFLSCELFVGIRMELAKPNIPDLAPISVLEDFAKHAGITLHAACSPHREKWYEAIWGSDV